MPKKLLYKKNTNVIVSYGFTDFTPAADESMIDVPDSLTDDRRLDRADPSSAEGMRPATAAEIAAYDAAQMDAQAISDVNRRIVQSMLTYFVQRFNELRMQPQPKSGWPPLTETQATNDIMAIYKTLTGVIG